MSRTRDTAVDVIKILGAFFVVLLHSSSGLPGSILVNSISRFCVPLFLLVSGHYMLAREHTISSILRRCGRVLLQMLAWSGIFLLYQTFVEGFSPSGPGEIVTYLLTEPVHLWYCWAIATLYLLTPMLSVFCQHASRRQLEYALAVTFCFGSILLLAQRSGLLPLLDTILSKMKAGTSCGLLCLYLCGYYLRTYPPTKTQRRWLYALGAAGLAVTYLGTAALSWRDGTLNELFFSFAAPNLILYSLAVYVFLRQFLSRCSLVRWGDALSVLSGATGGIYFLHPLVLLMLGDFSLEPWLGWPVAAVCRAVCCFGVSLAAVLVLRRIPVLRRLT
jgi:surface polysaccharide O-acyltransferase-like enzyme